jgi:hypothetical protein
MRIRSALIAAAAVAAAATACSNTTAPMACDGNPKCKADLQPLVPSAMKLELGATPASQPARALPPGSVRGLRDPQPAKS